MLRTSFDEWISTARRIAPPRTGVATRRRGPGSVTRYIGSQKPAAADPASRTDRPVVRPGRGLA